MATRRPPMPRAGSSSEDPRRAAQNPAAAPGPASPAAGTADRPTAPGTRPANAAPMRPRTTREPDRPPVQRRVAQQPPTAKVIPLGRISDVAPVAEPAPKPKAKPKGDHAAAKSAKPAKAPKGDHATAKSAKPAKTPKGSKPATDKTNKSERRKSIDSQRRIEDRNLLSGAVRQDEKAAKKQPKKAPEGPSKPIPARSFSGRILALSISLSVFAMLLVPSIGTYARQRDEIAALEAVITAKQAEQEGLKEQIARWDDPLYIKQQARDRINLVMPGERNYMVVGRKPTDAPPAEENHSPNEIRTDLPWVDALFDSVQRAATD
ncbi:septum formation initiator family protein [Paeniglutamicibacter sp. NPDC012692]|uniref:FtsB family cell division protein n=1 Tax=Paeniglutamicibacter sp. NPDC012692 TaxID=3364388 RepID=UPI003678B881